MKRKKVIDCFACNDPVKCCQRGAWADLEEAKKILELKIEGGGFSHMEKDERFPSGYKLGTSIEDEPCTFITPDGLCAIHKIDYNLKPVSCKEFPYDNKRLSSIAKHLCEAVKARHK